VALDDLGGRPALIASGQSLSGVIALGTKSLVAVDVPPGFTGTALTFQAGAASSGPWRNVYTAAGTELSITVGADRWVVLDPAAFAGAAYLKVRSGSAAAPSAQAADTTLGLVLGVL
jgi:hypothetical protein